MPHIPGAGPLILRAAERLNHDVNGGRDDVVATVIGVAAGAIAVSVDPVGTAITLARTELK